MTNGQKFAQLLHAAGESFSHPKRDGPVFAVALETSLENIQMLIMRLEQEYIPHVVIREPDPPFNGEITAVGICPDYKDEIYKYVKKFKLIV